MISFMSEHVNMYASNLFPIFFRSALFVGTSNHQVYALDSLVEEGTLEYEVKCVFMLSPQDHSI